MNELYNYLAKLNQSQLLTFYNELNEDEQSNLINEINSIDIHQINNIYTNSYINEQIDLDNITPLKHVIGKDIDDSNIDIGKEYIRNNKYAIVVLAGGVGSRVGLDIPKGCIELNINGKNISLFECYINQLKEVYNELNIYINMYIMTSSLNNDQILDYFKEHDYFNYPKDKIHFFKQDELPILDIKGKILLKDKSHILFGPNGNGNVFEALKKANLINHMKDNNIDKILFISVDNVLSKLVDYKFIGYTLSNNYTLASKTVFKENPNSKEWIYCKYNNKPCMIDNNYLNDDIRNIKDNNDYLYRDTNVVYHLIDMSELEKYSNITLKYHRAYKKNSYMDIDGNIINPEDNNTFKFEQFIFDAFEYSSDMLLYRVAKDEFAPIKTQEDIEYVSSLLSK